MKVACIGNMNNNMFCLVRYLRDRGLDCDLLMLWYEQGHFHPSCDSYGDDWSSYTRRLERWGAKFFDATSAEAFAADLADYDFLIGCNLAPAFTHKSGRTLDIFCPHGSDYLEVPFLTDGSGAYTNLALSQRKGIAEARHCFAGMTNATRQQQLFSFANRERWTPLPVPLLYLDAYAPHVLERQAAQSEACAKVRSLSQQADFLIFHHSRQCWKGGQPNDMKRNDVFFKGLARACREHGLRPAVVTFEYGPDVAASKELLAELGIGELVHWFAPLMRKEIMPMLWLADLVAVQFADTWLSGGVYFEGLAAAKPILTRRDDSVYSQVEEALPPVLNAADEQEVAARLVDFAQRPAAYAAYGERGRDWLRETRLEPAVAAMVEIINQSERSARS